MRFTKTTSSRLFTSMLAFATFLGGTASGQSLKEPLKTILFGAAYYEEYSPTDRLDEDIRLMKAANITVIRIAESTWGARSSRRKASSTSAMSIVF